MVGGMGYFITFEGVEGCGKTTQIRLLADQLASLGYRVLLTREPGGCPIADKVRTILLDAENRDMSSLTELMLYAAARAQHVGQVIAPALASGAIVLCDRFCDATVAYQHYGRGIDRCTIDTLNDLACQTLCPDLTLLMDCDPEVGLSRARSRIAATTGPKEERFELEQLSFHQRVRNGYLQQSATEPQRFVTLDASGAVSEIAEQIAAAVTARLEEAGCAIR